MPGAGQISDLLSQLRAEAEFESSGQFSLDFQKALEKVRILSQQNQARWLLFALQAAALLGSNRAEVSLSHHQASLTFVPRENADWQEILANPQSLTALSGDSNRALSRLCSCLLWARAFEPRELRLSLRSPEQSWLVELSKDQAEVGQHTQHGGAQVTLHLEFEEKSVSRTAAISQQLAERLSFSPVSVYQEGRRLNRGLPAGLDSLLGWYAMWILAERNSMSRLAAVHPSQVPASLYLGGDLPRQVDDKDWVPSVDVSEMIGPSGLQWSRTGQGLAIAPGVFLDCQDEPRWLSDDLQQQLLECRAFFYRVYAAESTCWMVQDGVLLDGQALDPGFSGWRVFLASQTAKTDLSGLKLVEDDTNQSLLKWVQAHIITCHQRESLRRQATS
jgi:hypothetical protein